MPQLGLKHHRCESASQREKSFASGRAHLAAVAVAGVLDGLAAGGERRVAPPQEELSRQLHRVAGRDAQPDGVLQPVHEELQRDAQAGGGRGVDGDDESESDVEGESEGDR